MRQAIGWRRAAWLVLALAVLCSLPAAAHGRGAQPRETGLTFFIRVLGVGDDGKVRPLANAVAGVVPGHVRGTDRNGYVVVQASEHIAAGDYITVVASKDEYRDERVRLLVDRDVYTNASRAGSSLARFISSLLGRREAVITLTLQPEDDAGPEVQLLVQVKDEDLKPVRGAVVSLVQTDPYRLLPYKGFASEGGEVLFVLPRELFENGLQARVYAGIHGRRFSDVPDSVTRGRGQRLFLVVLGKDATWSGTWQRREVAGTMTLVQSASGDVTGTWTWNDGTGKVSGQNTGGRLTGTFSESCCSGSFDLRLDGKSFGGTYTCRTGCGGSGSFTGTCVGGACLKNR